jgi:hypothetical protein
MDERGYVIAFYVATKQMVSFSSLMGKCDNITAPLSKKIFLASHEWEIS